MTAIIISASSKVRAESYALDLARGLKLDDCIELLGPVEAPIFCCVGSIDIDYC